MKLDHDHQTTIMQPQVDHTGEGCMVDQERWAEIQRLYQTQGSAVAQEVPP